MSRRILVLSAVVAVATLAGCGSSTTNPNSLPTASLTVVVSPESVVANGTSTVSVTVSGASTGAISISANRGVFSNGLKVVQVTGTPATLALTSCNESLDVACPGTVVIRAVDAVGVAGQASATFTSSGVDPSCLTCGAAACVGVVCDSQGHTCSADSPSTCTTCPGGATEICNDGRDNNCNGLVDCADPQCQPVGNQPGAVCDVGGHTCSVNGAPGPSACTVCSGNGGAPEARETSCGDGRDNDCNGLTDCQDPDCAGLACSPFGLTCSATAKTCSVCPGGQAVETTCNDGVDNDCNGKVDCADLNCQPTIGSPGKTCGPFGKSCSSDAGGTCGCSGNGGIAEATETSCGDGFDNDCNGKIDCADSACAGQSCDGSGSVGKTCSAGLCTCLGGATEICNDGIDNNCNGLTDCQDTACRPSGATPGASCDAAGNRCSTPAVGAPSTCTVCSGNGKPPEVTESSCSDGVDNDCDGRTDCADANCLGLACNAASPAYVCLNVGGTVSCSDPTSQYSMLVAAARNRIPADGAAVTTITATLKQNGVPQVGKTVTFASSLAGTTLSTAGLTDANGQTTVTFTANDTGGAATITATYAATVSLNVTGTTVVTLPSLGQVNLLSQQHDILGVRSSGFQETSLITFQVLDAGNEPYPAGLTVAFVHQSLGGFGVPLPGEEYRGSWIGPSANCSGSPTMCRAEGTTDAQGRVSVLLTSGQAAGVVAVSAGSTAGGLSTSGTASNIAIVGAKASGAHIQMSCGFTNQAVVSDCRNSYTPTPIACTVALADRFNNVVGVSTLVQYFSEGGTAGPPAYTPAYDPTKPPTAQTGLGLGESYVRSDGQLPIDVAPFGGEFRLAYADGCGTLEHNPRDGLVTVIGVSNGEEGFVDVNANGVYDVGEPFIDMGEPYIDANDNGVHDSGEFFIDYNRSGVYEGPNGRWDNDAAIWAETRVLFTGYAVSVSLPPLLPTTSIAGSQFYTSGVLPEPDLASAFSVKGSTPGPATSQTYGVVFTDGNFNSLSPAATFAIQSIGGLASTRFSFPPLPRPGVSMSFTQQYCSQPSLQDVQAGDVCSNVCPSSPCYVVTNVGACDAGTGDPATGLPRTGCTGFYYGSIGSAVITGGANVGADTIQATATVIGVTSPIQVSGSVIP